MPQNINPRPGPTFPKTGPDAGRKSTTTTGRGRPEDREGQDGNRFDRQDRTDQQERDPLETSTPTRGASKQGERQDAKGGPAGANQGGAPRGGSRIEPSHQKQALKKDQPTKPR